jgi:hypothetical protein
MVENLPPWLLSNDWTVAPPQSFSTNELARAKSDNLTEEHHQQL